MKLDLHLHSDRSDGMWRPERLAQEAAARRLRAWAITDHDSLAGWSELAGAPGLLSAVELSAAAEGREVHLVALGLQPKAVALVDHLARVAGIRRARAELILASLRRRLGRAPSLAECWPERAAVITRSHLAQALVRAGLCAHPHAAFADLIGDRALADLDLPPLPGVAEVAAVARGVGAVLLLAHPGIYGDIALIERLMVMGNLDGLETNHPRLAPSLRVLLCALAQKHGWLQSAGSDFHGGPCRMGDWRLSRGVALPLLRRCGWCEA